MCWARVGLKYFKDFFFYLKAFYGKTVLFSEGTSTSIWIFLRCRWVNVVADFQRCLKADGHRAPWFLNVTVGFGASSLKQRWFCCCSVFLSQVGFPNQVLQLGKL